MSVQRGLPGLGDARLGDGSVRLRFISLLSDVSVQLLTPCFGSSFLFKSQRFLAVRLGVRHFGNHRFAFLNGCPHYDNRLSVTRRARQYETNVICFLYDFTKNPTNTRGIPQSRRARHRRIARSIATGRTGRRTRNPAPVHTRRCRRIRPPGHTRARLRHGNRGSPLSRIRGDRASRGRARRRLPLRHDSLLMDDARRRPQRGCHGALRRGSRHHDARPTSARHRRPRRRGPRRILPRPAQRQRARQAQAHGRRSAADTRRGARGRRSRSERRRPDTRCADTRL